MSYDTYKKRAFRSMLLEQLFAQTKALITLAHDERNHEKIDDAYQELVKLCEQIELLPPPDISLKEN